MIKKGDRVRYIGKTAYMRRLRGVVTNIVTVNRRQAVWWLSDKDIKEHEDRPWMCPIEDVREES